MYYKRTLERTVLDASAHFPALFVTGARQVGKTTLLTHLAERASRRREPRRTIVSLDHTGILELARRDPALFLQRFPPPVLIDEIQDAPGLFPHLKAAIDRDRRPGMFWLTGSQPFHLMRGLSETLAGRIAILALLGLSRRERLGIDDDGPPFLPEPELVQRRAERAPPLPLPELYREIFRGSFPGMAADPGMDRDLFFDSYVKTYLQRDLRDLSRVGDETAFLRFLRATAARTGCLLNMAELARDADIAPNTAKAWLSILETTGILFRLEPWHTHLTRRLVKAPKLHFLDTGLAAWLAAWSSPETLAAGAMAGPILETWAVVELLKSWHHRGKRPPFFHYRDRDGIECDLVIESDGRLHPIEIKRTASPSRDDIRAFRAVGKPPRSRGAGGLVCLAAQSLPLDDTAVTIPVGAL